ncbi:hypothetical protein LEP1GSC188_4685 [Leptospira weilii serovar Topaz str. LT2116]|uniref:Uncharacterized protein n=1 Tax=Leptospira weilii serovar Topaz str. LT2116 TaxID=1088540 RepID=M3FKM9_9LEPT|nr:hypothetical protein LEP1GSC188_4685 [Leptospira weilii serovar Topaz str. LT2116]
MPEFSWFLSGEEEREDSGDFLYQKIILFASKSISLVKTLQKYQFFDPYIPKAFLICGVGYGYRGSTLKFTNFDFLYQKLPTGFHSFILSSRSWHLIKKSANFLKKCWNFFNVLAL